MRFWGLGLGLAVLLTATSAFATRVVQLSPQNMAQRATVVIHARAVSQIVQRDPQTQRPVTLTQLEILEGVKGWDQSTTATLYQVGGTLDGITRWIPGNLKFEPGEEFVLFGERHRGYVITHSIGQGKYVVSRESGIPMVQPQYGGVLFMQRDPQGQLRATTTPQFAITPLEDFINDIKGWAGGTP